MIELNDILILKGSWTGAPNTRMGGGEIHFPRERSYPLSHLEDLSQNLKDIGSFWAGRPSIGGCLFSIHYRELVAKSNRVSLLLSVRGNIQDTVRGARFELDDGLPVKHVITHFIQRQELSASTEFLDRVAATLRDLSITTVSQDLFTRIGKQGSPVPGVSKTRLLTLLKDAAFIEYIAVDLGEIDSDEEDTITSFYRTGVALGRMLGELGVVVTPEQYLDQNTLLLTPAQKQRLRHVGTYLVSMAVSDLAEIAPVNTIPEEGSADLPIPEPSGDEPVVGVIDTLFDCKSYFAGWVEAHNDPVSPVAPDPQDYRHGTEVASIIVDGPARNPRLDDGCGRMRVRHFGIAVHGKNSRFALLKKIREIVSSNTDIHVWNVSLGSEAETMANRISPEAAFLDELQSEFDITFVVAATNSKDRQDQRIGAPADTINGISVGAICATGAPADYTRHGPVLHFFVKPDVACFGGELSEPMRVWRPPFGGAAIGTSFAAPWIARKMAYLVEKMKLPRESAKALLIDSAVGWGDYPKKDWERIGYGAVPIRIQDILQSQPDEIRFLLHAVTKNYRTYLYDIPIPRNKKGEFNFHARATVCYYPVCSREQGVDYTLTELDVRFGRVKFKNNGDPEIQDIRIPATKDPRFAFLREKTARQMFQKWANVKVLYKDIKQPNKSYSPYWGVRIDMADRLGTYSKRGMPFSVVVTLKEADGVNEIHRFCQACQARGWIVETLNVEQRMRVNTQAQEEILLE